MLLLLFLLLMLAPIFGMQHRNLLKEVFRQKNEARLAKLAAERANIGNFRLQNLINQHYSTFIRPVPKKPGE